MAPRLVIAVLLAIPATAGPQWGPAQNNLQLGVEWRAGGSSQSAPALLVSIRNAGTELRDLAIGVNGSAGPAYNVKIRAVGGQSHSEKLVFDLNALKMQVSSFPSLRSVRLQPGEIFVITYPLTQLICVIDRRDTPLQQLLDEGYSLRVSFEAAPVELHAPILPPPQVRNQ